MQKVVRRLISSLLLVALPAGAATISDFTLSSGHGFDANPQSIISLIQVNPTPYNPNPPLSGVDVNFLVSYGTIGNFTGMFFEFINQSTSPNASSSLTAIKFQTPGLLNNPRYLQWSGAQVSYSIGGNVPNGGFQISFNDSLNTNPTSPGGYSKNGITNGEHLLVGFTIDQANGYTYQNLLENLLIGGPDDYKGWTIAGHLQKTEGTSSSIWLASHTDNQSSPFPQDPGSNPVVPVPAAAGLGMLGLAFVGILRRRRS